VNAARQVGPVVGHRIFQVEHHARRAAVQHFDHQFSVVCGAGHLVSLVLNPAWQFDHPIARRGLGGRPVIGQSPLVRLAERFGPFGHQRLLARSEDLMQRRQKIHEAPGQFQGGVEVSRRAVHPGDGDNFLFASEHLRDETMCSVF
jgi:hypothetical protein